MARAKELPDSVYRRWRNSMDALSEFFTLGARCKDYIAGRQWTPEEIEAMRQRNQAPVVYNQLAAVRRFVLSVLDAMRLSVTVLPRSADDVEKAWVMAQVLDSVMDVNGVDTKRLWVARDALDTGVGWWVVQRQQDLTQDPIDVDWVPWNEMIWDVAAKKPDLSDAWFMDRIKWAEVDAVVNAFPEYRKQIEECRSSDRWMPGDTFSRPAEVDEFGRTPQQGVMPFYDRTRDMVQVMEWWEYRYETLPCLFNGDVLVPYDEELHAELVANGEHLVDAPVKVPYVQIICGPWVLYEARKPYWHFWFPFVPVVFDWDDVKHIPRGLMADLLDPQDEVNKRRSKAIHFLNMNQVIMEEGAVPSVDDLRDELADPEGIIVKRPNKHLEVLRNMDLAKGHLEMMMEALSEIRQVSGVYQDAVGQPTNARTGAAIVARQQGTQTSLVLFLKNAANGERQMATRVMSLIKQFYRAERVLRLTDETGKAAFISLNRPVVDAQTGRMIVENSLQSLQGDLAVSFRQPFATERQAMAATVAEVLKGAPPQVQPALIQLWLDFLNVPSKDAIRQQLMQAAQQVAIQPAQEQPQ